MSLPTVTMRLDGRGIRRLHCGRVDGGFPGSFGMVLHGLDALWPVHEGGNTAHDITRLRCKVNDCRDDALCPILAFVMFCSSRS
jgi:hypothetical protein